MPGTTTNLQLPYPTPDDTVDVPRDVRALAEKLDPMGVIPIGGFIMWPTAVAPLNWLLMQGQKVAAAVYPQLAVLLGQDANQQVTIPDWRDMFPVGAGPTMPLNTTGGAAAVGLVDANNGPHAHAFAGTTGPRDRSQSHGHTPPGGGYFALYLAGGGIVYYSAPGGEARPGDVSTGGTDPADHMHPFSGATDSRGSGVPHENRPPFRAANFIIRAG